MDILDLTEFLENKSKVLSTFKKSIQSVEFSSAVIDDEILNNFENYKNFEGTPFYLIGGEYSPYTQRKKGLGAKEVNLLDTGDFYKSYEVKEKDYDYTIEADTIKGSQDLEERWGELEAISKEAQRNTNRELEDIFWENVSEAL